MRPAAHGLVNLIEAGHSMGRLPGGEWPWTWVRLIQHIKQVRTVYERAAYAKDPKSALPPRWMWFESAELDKWFEERRK